MLIYLKGDVNGNKKEITVNLGSHGGLYDGVSSYCVLGGLGLLYDLNDLVHGDEDQKEEVYKFFDEKFGRDENNGSVIYSLYSANDTGNYDRVKNILAKQNIDCEFI